MLYTACAMMSCFCRSGNKYCCYYNFNKHVQQLRVSFGTVPTCLLLLQVHHLNHTNISHRIHTFAFSCK